MNNSTDGGIPLLTEVIDAPERVAAPQEFHPAPAPVPEISAPIAPRYFAPSTPVAPVMHPSIEPPMLQEVIEESIQPSIAEAAPLTHAPIHDWMEEEWTRLEQKISERVLTQVLDRVDTVIDQRIRDGLMDVLQITLDRLSDDLKHGLHQTLQGVITEAVTQEIERMRFSEK